MPDLRRRTILMGAATGVLAAGPATADGPAAKPEDWATLSRKERDTAYNNSAAFPEGVALVEGWTKASAQMRAANAKTVDLAYGPRERNKWDLFPASDPKAPCLVFIHGGFWQARSRENFSCIMEGVLAAGFAAALPGYTLAPDATLTEIVAEIRSALDWLAGQGPRHGIAGPVILSGWSAGGHLAAMTLDHPSAKAGFAISGIYELGPLRETYVNDKLRLSDGEMATLSPSRLPPIAKPLTLAYGTGELPALVENSRAFHTHRSALHGAGALVPVPRTDHFSVLEDLRAKDGSLMRVVSGIASGLSS